MGMKGLLLSLLAGFVLSGLSDLTDLITDRRS